MNRPAAIVTIKFSLPWLLLAIALAAGCPLLLAAEPLRTFCNPFNLDYGWWVQSFGRTCTAASSLTNHPSALAADENCRTWWSAQTGNAGEWFQMDLGQSIRVNAVPLNFAEQDGAVPPPISGDDLQRYKLLASNDGTTWRALPAPGAGHTSDTGGRATAGPHDYFASRCEVCVARGRFQCQRPDPRRPVANQMKATHSLPVLSQPAAMPQHAKIFWSLI